MDNIYSMAETPVDKLMNNEEKDEPEGEPPKKVTFDAILIELGEFGLEQKINYFLFSLPYILTSMQLMGWVFVGASAPHRCRVPGDPVPGGSVTGFYNIL